MTTTDLTKAEQHAISLSEAATAFANKTCAQANALVVTTDAEADFAAQVALQFNTQIKAFDKEREPMRDIKRTADKAMKRWTPAINAMKDCVSGIRSKIEVYRNSKRELQAAALTEATSKEEVTQAVAVLAPKPAGTIEREEWDIEIVDEDAIPRTFWIRDDAKLRATARALKEGFNVPGVRAVKRMVPVFRG